MAVKALAIALFCAAPMFAARVGGTSGNTGSAVSSFSVSYTAVGGSNHMLSVACVDYSVGGATVSDGVNAYTRDGQTITTNETASLSSARNVAAGSLTITCTYASPTPFGVSIAVNEFSNTPGVVDGSAVTIHFATACPDTVPFPSITPSNLTDLVVAAYTPSDDTTVVGAVAPFTIGSVFTTSAGSPGNVFTAYQQTSVAITPSLTNTPHNPINRCNGVAVAYSSLNAQVHHAVTQSPGSRTLAATPSIGTYSQAAIGADAYSATNLNMVSVANNNLTTYNGNQYGCYWDTHTVPQLVLTRRVLSSNAVTRNVTSLTPNGAQAPYNATDTHNVCSLGIDKNGFLHISYGMHASALQYCISTLSESIAGQTCPNTMLGTNESSVSYPVFIKRAGCDSCELYFWFRDGVSGNGDQYFYHYNAAGTAWVASTGTGTAGIVINGKSDVPSHSAYPFGPPVYLPNNNLVFNWTNATNSANGVFIFSIQWNGTSFFKSDGVTAQTIPATAANVTASYTGTSIVTQTGSCVDSGGKLYITFGDTGGAAYNQIHVLTNYSGSFVDHILTSNSTVLAGDETQSTCISYGGRTWVIFPDRYGQQTGMLGYLSTNGFSTSQVGYVFQNYNPNWQLSADQTRTDAISFLTQQTCDPQYGVTCPPAVGSPVIQVIDWVPAP